MHTEPHLGGERLSDLVDAHQARGRYVLTREEALRALGISDEALKKAVQRLVAKRRRVVPRRGFYVIVPVEYRDADAPPPSWFTDELMKFHGQPYYVGILSAAALHGAAHQQPQEFQIITKCRASEVPPEIQREDSQGGGEAGRREFLRFLARLSSPRLPVSL
jgi:predicted transcriptional regulator of viral defense system